MRVTEAMSDGMVLPIAWNMLEHTKISPDATKFHEMMRRYSSPTAMTAGSSEKTRMSAAGTMLQSTAISSIQPAAIRLASLNTALTRSPSRAPTFWPATGATEKPSATTGMNSACTTRMPMPKPGLRRGAERPRDRVDEHQVDGHHRELGAGRQPDLQHVAPQRELRPQVAPDEAQIALAAEEVGREPRDADHHRDERGDRRAGHAHRPRPCPSRRSGSARARC